MPQAPGTMDHESWDQFAFLPGWAAGFKHEILMGAAELEHRRWSVQLLETSPHHTNDSLADLEEWREEPK